MARPRKPTHLKVVAGTERPSRVNKAEPKPRRKPPAPPSHLSDKAREAWAAVSVLLDRMGVLTEADGMAVEGLCEAYADLYAAREALSARGGLTYETVSQTGAVMHRPYPEVSMIADADRRFRMWLASVGLTPADRSKVAGEPVAEESPWDQLGVV
ncbi:phage terminase small subunit P27 family [Pseudoroseomonas cervicalis]|uniref:phage terminase small subunit P27 family n=1 Tax=Teichococcus cervicalis TaxID=204525 RepID=UPI00277D6A17|nr:phage terminase small subunit P27 family [Pseudoroseomonas cervicalis]MDQ1077996.1 P27 family predicted phage terminase small subunit [Pseudoroseomonas cervicalis]